MSTSRCSRRAAGASRTPLRCWGTSASPLLLTPGGGYFALTSEEQVVAGLQPQVGQMRAAGYARSEILGAEVTC